MAIPSMSDSSKLGEVSTLVCLDDGLSSSESANPEGATISEITPAGKKYQSSKFRPSDNKSVCSCFSNRQHQMVETKDERRARKTRQLVSDHNFSKCSEDKYVSSSLEQSPLPQEDFQSNDSHLQDHPHSTDISRLFLHRLEVDTFSYMASHSSISDIVDPKSDLAYIYAESIKGCESSSCMNPEDCSSHKPLLKTYKQEPVYACSSSDCDLYISKNLSGNSNEATAGSNSFNTDHLELPDDIDLDSACIYTEWNLNPVNAESTQQHSLVQAEWSSFSSNYEILSCDRESNCSSDYLVLDDIDYIKHPAGWPEVCFPGFEGCFVSPEEFDGVKDAHRDSDSDSETAQQDSEQWGVVTQTDQHHFAEFFCGVIKEVMQKKDTRKNSTNEGFLFHPKQFLKARDSEYREGHEYSVLRHIQNGSYGDVFCIRDKQSGFTCAAKKIPLSSFGWEEVETWSRLESPRVLQLYGLVREGPNVTLFMDLKSGSLAELLRTKVRLSETLALFYHAQVLQALQHLHSRCIVHLDIKVDNVLLSDDERQCFLCDFGLSETLNKSGYSSKTYRGSMLRGTESHMPPEVARGDPCSAKADVWSSCCMLLHMLSGHQPWIRSFPHPLCLKIVNEPPPLWEIPPECDPLTCDVIKGGLVKEPEERDSTSELLQKTIGALKTVCGLNVPEASLEQALEESHNRTLSNALLPYVTKNSDHKINPAIRWLSSWRETAAEEDFSDSDEDLSMNDPKTSSWMERYWGEEQSYEECCSSELDSFEDSDIGEGMPVKGEPIHTERFIERKVVFGEYDTSLLEESISWDGDVRSLVDDEEVQSDLESLRELGRDWVEECEPFVLIQTLYAPKESNPLSDESYSESEEESLLLRKSEQKGSSLSEFDPQALTSCCDSMQDFTEEGSDDLSSGVFSSCSSSDGQSFNVDWSVSTHQTSSCYFEGLGVDIWVEDVSGESLKIRERLQVKIGHIAVGISDQISLRTFSLATLDGRLVSPDTEVCESGLWLQCVPAPDSIPNWDWRIKDGKLELRQNEQHSDSCSTVTLEHS